MEEAVGGRSDTPIHRAMEMATVVTSIASETVGATIFEIMERNENGKRRRRSEAAAAPSDWRTPMERTIRQLAQELTQLHRTVGHLTNLCEVRAAREKAQWQGMMAWMQEREHKWDACHEDDNLWGAGITNMIAKVMKGVAPGQEVRQKKKEKRLQGWTVGGYRRRNMQIRREKRAQSSTNSRSSNRSPNCSSNCSVSRSPHPNQSQHPHVPEGVKLSNTEPRGRARAQPRHPARVWQLDGWSREGTKASPDPIRWMRRSGQQSTEHCFSSRPRHMFGL